MWFEQMGAFYGSVKIGQKTLYSFCVGYTVLSMNTLVEHSEAQLIVYLGTKKQGTYANT